MRRKCRIMSGAANVPEIHAVSVAPQVSRRKAAPQKWRRKRRAANVLVPYLRIERIPGQIQHANDR